VVGSRAPIIPTTAMNVYSIIVCTTEGDRHGRDRRRFGELGKSEGLSVMRHVGLLRGEKRGGSYHERRYLIHRVRRPFFRATSEARAHRSRFGAGGRTHHHSVLVFKNRVHCIGRGYRGRWHVGNIRGQVVRVLGQCVCLVANVWTGVYR